MFTFTLTSDSHIGAFAPGSAAVFEAVLRDMLGGAYQPELFVSLGDCTENGTRGEWKTYFELLKRFRPADDYIVIQGNHDIRFRRFAATQRRFCAFYNDLTGERVDRYYFAKDAGGYRFICLGSERTQMEKITLSPTQLDWLDMRLEESAGQGRPVFVLCHEPLRNTHGLPDIWDMPVKNTGHVGAQSDALQAILRRYKNVFFLTGHMHTGFGRFTYQEVDGIHSVNLPAAGDKVNKSGEVADHGLGMVAEVYEDRVVFRARNFLQGEWLPQYDRTYPLV